MSTVAEQLRNARQARNLSLEQVAEITKMRTDQVRALEQGEFEVFSAQVYLRGSVRTYATLLKLDVPVILTALEEELSQSGASPEPGLHQVQHDSGFVDRITLLLSKLDWRKGAIGALAAILLVLMVVGYFAWRNYKTNDPLRTLKPGIYQPVREPGPVLPLPNPQQNRR
jgi:cytoskeleton protein RodZ